MLDDIKIHRNIELAIGCYYTFDKSVIFLMNEIYYSNKVLPDIKKQHDDKYSSEVEEYEAIRHEKIVTKCETLHEVSIDEIVRKLELSRSPIAINQHESLAQALKNKKLIQIDFQNEAIYQELVDVYKTMLKNKTITNDGLETDSITSQRAVLLGCKAFYKFGNPISGMLRS